jgi:hypothetical protein
LAASFPPSISTKTASGFPLVSSLGSFIFPVKFHRSFHQFSLSAPSVSAVVAWYLPHLAISVSSRFCQVPQIRRPVSAGFQKWFSSSFQLMWPAPFIRFRQLHCLFPLLLVRHRPLFPIGLLLSSISFYKKTLLVSAAFKLVSIILPIDVVRSFLLDDSFSPNWMIHFSESVSFNFAIECHIFLHLFLPLVWLAVAKH